MRIPSPLSIRFCRYHGADRKAVMRLLASIGDKYPGGLAWLDRRLDDIEAGKASADLAMIGGRLAGAAIYAPKGKRHVKLCTFYIDPAVRGNGMGRRLLGRLLGECRKDEIDDLVLTVDVKDVRSIGFFRSNGFEALPGPYVDYGDDRRDMVMRWTPNANYDAVTASFAEA